MVDSQADRLIFVAGCPSGGTSAVASVLYHLGVDMGTVMLREGTRGYTTYEDTQANNFKDGAGQLHVAAYCDFRLGSAKHPHAGKYGLRGFKHTPLWLSCEDELPIDVILVKRPLEDAIRSDQQKVAKLAAEGRPGYPKTLRDFRDRAGTVARAWVAAQQVAATYRCLLAVDFYSLLAEQRLVVSSIATALGLPTEGPRFDKAVASVEPGRRSV